MALGTEIALIKALGGGSGGGLPEVTSADAGKVLGVNDSGVWGAQEPIGKKFIVTLTPTAQDYSGTMDKTVAEIDAAYKAGQEIWFEISDGYTTNSFAMTMIYRDNSAYPSFTGYIIYHDMIIDVATGSTNLGTSNTYNTIVYTLTPAT